MAKKLQIPDIDLFTRLQNDILTDEMKSWLYQTYQDSPTLATVILEAMESSWMAVNREYLEGNIPLTYEWSSHKVSDIDVFQKTIPNNFVDYMHRFGYDAFFEIPEKFKLGLAITFEFSDKVEFPMISNRDGNMVTVSKFYVSDFYFLTTDDKFYFYRCMTRQMA